MVRLLCIIFNWAGLDYMVPYSQILTLCDHRLQEAANERPIQNYKHMTIFNKK